MLHNMYICFDLFHVIKNEENEIIEDEGDDFKNITNLDTMEESRSSHVKKPSKQTGTPNEVRQTLKQKDLSQDYAEGQLRGAK